MCASVHFHVQETALTCRKLT